MRTDPFAPMDFAWHGGETRRYHGFRMLMEDTVGHHSFNVAHIIMFVQPDARAELLRAALKHDVAEHIVGDMPAPTKRAAPPYVRYSETGPREKISEISFREWFGSYEASTAADHGFQLDEELTDAEKWLLKFADSLDGMRFCLNEAVLGNRHPRLIRCYHTFEGYVATLLWGDEPPSNYVDRRMTAPLAPATGAAKNLYMEVKGRWYDAVERK